MSSTSAPWSRAINRIQARLDAEGWGGYGTFVNAVSFYAIDRRFAGIRNDNAIIRFVAEMRTEEDLSDVELSQAAELADRRT